MCFCEHVERKWAKQWGGGKRCFEKLRTGLLEVVLQPQPSGSMGNTVFRIFQPKTSQAQSRNLDFMCRVV
jgi:hypothetical protein